ncbi:MAG: DUF3656 domain-containing protein [Oscillospiraceae bacterium]|nr:DUF3656 domain-containing protein [Oscillospiraceae bacterium]MDD4413918.1 DUF3656 domain-containing protein [Oscillospiraceae bacterium]
MSDTIEILAPAGSPQALTAAIRSGADAVYLGAGSFNARRNAHNFDAAALREAAAFCRSRGVRLYLTLNTLIRQNEMLKAIELAEQACLLGIDALIIQDTGLARRIHAAAPDMPLHASTQLSCHTPEGVRELAEMGFKRVVLAREMKREEIAECAGLGLELEVFVHGALCMSVSGQCYLSAMLGGRSGNRGLCAQPCRLPFSAKSHPDTRDKALSLRDLSLYDYVKEMLSIGVHSLKIEGRMKRPEYVAGASACFAAARDAALGKRSTGAAPELLSDLRSAFSRSGFTDGYYTGVRGSSMFGSRTYEDVAAATPALGRLVKLYDRERPALPVKMTFTMRAGQPATLTAQDENGNSITVDGDIPETAVNRPLDNQRAVAQISKTGGTPFIAETECYISEGLNLPLSAINALRREALDKLLLKRSTPVPIKFNLDKHPLSPNSESLPFIKKNEKDFIIARFSDYKQIPDNDDSDMIFVPSDTPLDILKQLADNRLVGIEIPRGLFSGQRQTEKQLKNAAAAGIKTVLCGNIGVIPLVRQAGLYPVAGFGMNITNSDALDAMAERGVAAAVLSFELTLGQMRFAKEASVPCGIIAYGHLPLMLLRNCPVGSNHGCTSCGGSGGLTDRRGKRFPVVCKSGCAELLNSTPLWLADELNELPELDFLLLHFTDESPSRAADIISAYRSGGEPPGEFTRGLYKRGVE